MNRQNSGAVEVVGWSGFGRQNNELHNLGLHKIDNQCTIPTYWIASTQCLFFKTAFCLGEKHGMLVNNECSSWYNRVGNFLVSIWDTRKQLLYTDRLACMTQQNNPTPPGRVVNGTECYDGWVWAIYSFIDVCCIHILLIEPSMKW